MEIKFHSKQYEMFYEDRNRFKVCAKGRRFGFTRGLANFVIYKMLTEKVSQVLWVDTTYSNIQRYFERYFLPSLKGINKKLWKYNKTRSDLKIGNMICDFRSADRPENLEGFGYRLIILNEAGIILNDSALWNESIRPMALDYQAEVIIGGTPKGKRNRKGEKHLFFELYERGLRKEKGWKAFNYTSYDNPMLIATEIDELVKEISPALRDQEIYGKFIDTDNIAILKKEWWKYGNIADVRREKIIKIVQSWDTAFKKAEENDYSVCTTWIVTEGCYFLANVWRDRVEFPELKRKFIELYEKYKPTEVLIEDKASGISLIQELEANTRIPIKKIKVDADKISRCHSITPIIEGGKVMLNEAADWVNEFLYECEEFPRGQFDDQVDSMVQFLNYARSADVRYEIENVITAKKYRDRKFRGYRI